jgi:hypothetical protein
MAITVPLRTFFSKFVSNAYYDREGGWKGEVKAIRDMLNRVVVTLASYGQPGVVTTACVNSKGSSSAKAWKVTDGVAYFRGKAVALATAETALTATTHDTAASKESWYVLSQQTGGTKTITKGADQTIGTVVLPAVPDNEIAIGWMQIITGAGGIFDATTDDLTPTGTTTGIAVINFYDAPALGTINAAQS